MKKSDTLQRLNDSRKTIISLFVGALSLLFTQTLVSYLKDKLANYNFFGIDVEVFEIILIGVIIVILSYFGIVKAPKEN